MCLNTYIRNIHNIHETNRDSVLPEIRTADGIFLNV